jgi:ferric-dicitrate binding protein FerR (iron transport regulator)
MKSNFEIENKEKKVFSNLKPNYSKNKKEVWSEINLVISQNELHDEKETTPTIKLWFKYSIAASFLVLLSIGISMRLYTTEIYTLTNEITNHILPDGSIIELNAVTTISYHPYWWKFNRSVNLEGEAFFKVQKGEEFNVISSNGTTQVLGTSFNIYSRNEKYNVYCKSGKVRVIDNELNEVILQPGLFAEIETNKIQLKNKINPELILAWKSDMFIYKNTPLKNVFKDFETYYGIKIETNLNAISNLSYSGFFKRKTSINQALEIVCYSFDLKLDKINNNHYLVK